MLTITIPIVSVILYLIVVDLLIILIREFFVTSLSTSIFPFSLDPIILRKISSNLLVYFTFRESEALNLPLIDLAFLFRFLSFEFTLKEVYFRSCIVLVRSLIIIINFPFIQFIFRN